MKASFHVQEYTDPKVHVRDFESDDSCRAFAVATLTWEGTEIKIFAPDVQSIERLGMALATGALNPVTRTMKES